MAAVWRLLEHGPVEGARNMAIDRAVQLAVEAGDAPPTLRLYSWARPTVTLGRFQPAESLDWGAVEEYGCDVARRFTGGRGVLHDDELTYAVVARTADGVPRGVAHSYRYLCEALADAYRRIGVDASVNRLDRHATRSAACYLANTRADLSLGARKLSGSAQVWHGTTVLQHGSFTISRDLEREARVFALDAGDRALLEESSATIAGASAAQVAAPAIAAAVVAAFEHTLGIALEPGALTCGEEALVATLAESVTVTAPGAT